MEMVGSFDYASFSGRNLGFITAPEQDRLRQSTVFVCGVGGMGGACVQALVRAGVGRLVLADVDHFELSNLNRQVFAFTDTVGEHKAEATAAQCRRINPDLDILLLREDWPVHAEDCVSRSGAVVNGTDDLAASLLLYRTSRRLGRPVVDAYASPLPSVYVTRPHEAMPEERLGYPTRGTAWDALSDDQRREAFLREAEYVLLHSSSRKYIDLGLAAEVAAGQRSRMSFAPMVITTGMLMAYETIALLLGRTSVCDCRGWFFNPYAARVEHPRNPFAAALLRPLVRYGVRRLLEGAAS
ncbi:ThiF family adenylyltransferase [Lysobacter soli]|uniref:ThiF family adenylyltransferase n=1 Tax=Lysobacter TaxID=68 RepID=UPI0019FC6DB6|nr:ThiF family adenylyltransferase [Lysobacter soli]UTA55695.1 ThiF family adenylyltransferase [Lysobacter soli]